MEILCFFAGTVFFYTKSLYPLFFIIVSLLLKAPWSVLMWFIAAILWSCIHAHWNADHHMPHQPVIPHASLIGQIESIPLTNDDKTQFQFRATSLDSKPVNTLIMLNCYEHCPLFQIGEVWSLQAKLKKPANLANPGAFDYLAWLSSRHIAWTGYIKKGRSLRLQQSKANGLSDIRQKLAYTLARKIPQTEVIGIVQALTLGVTNQIKPQQWDLFRRTGTIHLMVISGAHIGLVAGLAFFLCQWLWRRSARLCLYYPAIQIASLAGLATATIYALLAGFGVPAQRALAGCLFLMSCNLSSHRYTVWQTWRYGLFAVLVYEPHAVLLPGFYLSFLAVAILVLTSQRLRVKGLKKILGLQLACLLGLLPLTLYWFSYGAINGLLANLIAIPMVGYLIVPLALLNLSFCLWFG